MNPKDVFIHHLNTLLLFTGARYICVFDTQQKNMGDLVAGDVSQSSISETFCAEDVLHYIELERQATSTDSFHFFQSDQSTLVVRVLSTNSSKSSTNTNHPNTRRAPIASKDPLTGLWLKLRFPDAIPAWLTDPAQNGESDKASKLSAFEQLLQSSSLQIQMVNDYLSLLSDPLTNLCSRGVLQSKITQLSRHHSIGLVMLHCIDFHQINRKFGHDYGDLVIQEIAANLQQITREGDILCRFGGALFGVAFPVNEQTNVASLAKKLQQVLQQKQYLDGAINVFFDLGAAIVEFDETFASATEKASALMNRADQALKSAQLENLPSIITWHKDDFSLYQQQFNYLGGIFTADTVTDYRNMLLLWDISTLIADKYEFRQLLQSVVQRLAQTFDFMCAGLVIEDESAGMQYCFSIDKNDNAIELSSKDSAFLPDLRVMQKNVIENRKPSERFVGNAMLLVLPMEIESPDCFFICGDTERFHVKHDTKVLLSGLTRQLGKALRRSRLEEELNRKLESQNAELQNELTQLKVGLQVSSIIFQSEAMHNLMKHAKRAAMTDTTVLVTGESGTGKERLINALHQMGNRSAQPFVIVDCGSIPETLIESELFGHVKGAFTGAQQSNTGKVLEANGGVLVLDEIGELPLQMQTKLLRFVQEKYFTPVGSNKIIEVDVKIIAVTNRDLAHEVELGTFRKDLYYRLNVLTLHNPPLRERVEDIPLLSSHFLSKFAEQFNVEKRVLSADALSKMRAYSWPGNIRELENRLMQATIISEGKVIEWDQLNIVNDPSNGHLMQQQPERLHQAFSISPQTANATPIAIDSNNPIFEHQYQASPAARPSSMVTATPYVTAQFIDSNDFLAQLLTIIKQQLALIGQHPQFFNAPVGSWIEDDLILNTYLACNRKMGLTAARLSISQSTARRRVDKIVQDRQTQQPSRPEGWQLLVDALMPIAKGEVNITECVAKIRLLVLEGILSTPVYSMAQAAEMLGVSEPTFYKLKRELDSVSDF